MKKSILALVDELATLSLGAKLASVCIQNCVIYINGCIGIGKSIFCKGFLYKLGYSGNVISPTYTFMESYVLTRHRVYHFDFYRIHSYEELISTGITEYFDDNAIFLVEWPKKEINLPKSDILVNIKYDNAHCHTPLRRAIITSNSEIGEIILDTVVL